MPTLPEIERSVRAALDHGDLQLAATRALEQLGPDVLRFLCARLRDQSEAEEAYLQFSEDFWVGLAAFRWESNLRTWMFVLARNAATRASRRRPREVALETGHESNLKELHARPRTATALYMRTEVKDRMREIRQRLEEDDQTLLILRIDRKLEWNELAVVMSEVAADASELALQRAAARLRTRFQTAKKRLRALAEADGLIRSKAESDDDQA